MLPPLEQRGRRRGYVCSGGSAQTRRRHPTPDEVSFGHGGSLKARCRVVVYQRVGLPPRPPGRIGVELHEEKSMGTPLDRERDAMRVLGWEPLDLWSAAIHLGHVGSVDDVRVHLATGDHLS